MPNALKKTADKETLQKISAQARKIKTREKDFAFSPNKGNPALLVQRRLSHTSFVKKAEEQLGIIIGSSAIFIGRVRKRNGVYLFQIDPSRSKGMVNLPKARRGMRKMVRSGVKILSKFRFAFPDEGESQSQKDRNTTRERSDAGIRSRLVKLDSRAHLDHLRDTRDELLSTFDAAHTPEELREARARELISVLRKINRIKNKAAPLKSEPAPNTDKINAVLTSAQKLIRTNRARPRESNAVYKQLLEFRDRLWHQINEAEHEASFSAALFERVATLVRVSRGIQDLKDWRAESTKTTSWWRKGKPAAPDSEEDRSDFEVIDPAVVDEVLRQANACSPTAPLATRRTIVASLQQLRDALKLNLEIIDELDEERRTTLSKEERFWSKTRKQVYERLRALPLNQPRKDRGNGVPTAPRSLPPLPKRHLPKKLKSCITAYERWSRSHTSSDDVSEHVLRLRALYQQAARAHAASPPKAQHSLAAVKRSVRDKIAEIQTQQKLDQGYIKTTGVDGTAAGASGSYLFGDEKTPHLGVVKPMFQEDLYPAAMTTTARESGACLRSEVLCSTVAATAATLIGQELKIPVANLVHLKSAYFAEVGARLGADELADSSSFHRDKAREEQPCVSIAFAPNRGDMAQRCGLRCSLPEDTDLPKWLDGYEISGEACSSNDTIRAHLQEEKGLTRAQALQAEKCFTQRFVKLPEDMDGGKVKAEAARGLMTCILTGQTDHGNLNNILIGEDGSLIPIDFGAAMPTPKQFARALSLARREGALHPRHPWDAWQQLPGSDAPISEEICAAFIELGDAAEEILKTAQREAERIEKTTDGAIATLSDECLLLQEFNLKASSHAVRRAKHYGLGLSVQELSGVFCETLHDQPEPPALVAIQAIAAEDLSALRRKDKRAYFHRVLETIFAQKVDEYLNWLRRVHAQPWDKASTKRTVKRKAYLGTRRGASNKPSS